MDEKFSLEEFRSKWKLELEQKKTIGHELLPNDTDRLAKVNSHPVSLVAVETSDQLNVNEHTCTYSKDKGFLSAANIHQQRTGSFYYPFGIVGRLLETTHYNQSSNVDEICTPKREKSCDQNKRVFESDSSFSIEKRKRGDKSNAFTQKIKKNKFDDIFSSLDNVSKDFKTNHEEDILDKFIADLDEITAIPFFDIALPKEVAIRIFQYLEPLDLCRCSQVSKEWKQIAEDELLWCRICHRMGFEEKVTTVERTKWKEIVKKNVLNIRQVHNNWKNRTAQLTPLTYIKGGMVCCIETDEDIESVVVGYSNGEVKLWSLDEEEELLFQPSDSSLFIDESQEEGTMNNMVEDIQVSAGIVAARYSHGNVDVWKTTNTSHQSPFYSVGGVGDKVTSMCLHAESGSLVTASGCRIVFHFVDKSSGHYSANLCQEWFGNKITSMKALTFSQDSWGVLVHTTKAIYLASPQNIIPQNSIPVVHELFGTVRCSCVSFLQRLHPRLAVGCDQCVYLYDLQVIRLLSVLRGHTHNVSCIHMHEEAANTLLITGCSDRRLRIFDTREENPVQILSGNAGNIHTVQMDEWKVISGDESGFVCLWDRRMGRKLWELHNRHPVKYCKFSKTKLVTGNIPFAKGYLSEESDNISLRRYRGSVHIYNFSNNQSSEDLPEICFSTYDEPEASNYNIGLAMPYDVI